MPLKLKGTKSKAKTTDEGKSESWLLQTDPGNRSSHSRRSL
jgi:hypothetical protein